MPKVLFMKKTLISVLLIVLLPCCLTGCGPSAVPEDPAPASTPEPTITPSPTPTPVPMLHFPDGSTHSSDETRLTLHTLAHKDVPEVAELLKQMPNLEYVDLGTDGAWTETERAELNAETAAAERPAEATRDLTWSDLSMLQEAVPQADLDYRFVFYGRYLSTLSEEMDLNHGLQTISLPCEQTPSVSGVPIFIRICGMNRHRSSNI